MQALTAQPYTKRGVPRSTGELPNFLTIELGNAQRGMARAGSRTVVADYTATVNDGLILADATAGVLTVTLPDPTDAINVFLIVKRTNGGGNAVTIGGTTDGTLNRTLGAQYAAKTVWSDGSAWYIVASV